MVKTAKMKCVFCNKETAYREIHVTLQPGSIRAKAWQCASCKDYYIDGEAAQKSLLLNQLQRGITIKLGELGNSLFFRIPTNAVRLLKLKKGSTAVFKVVPRGKRSVLEIQPV